MLELERTLSDMIIARDIKMNHYLEKLLIGKIIYLDHPFFFGDDFE